MATLRTAVILAVSLLAFPLGAQQKIDEFVTDTVQLLASAKNLRSGVGSRTTVGVVVGRNGDLEHARDVANKLEARAANEFPALSVSATAHRLDGRELSKVTGIVSAVVILQASLSDLNVLRAYAATPGVLMISRRPQDLGVFAVVVLQREIYVDEALLNRVQIVVGRKAIKTIDPAKIDPLSRMRNARAAAEKRVPDWYEAIKELRLAILARSAEDNTPVPVQGGTVPYVPHYFLSEALAMIDDCEAADAAKRLSMAQARKSLREQQKINTQVKGRCPFINNAMNAEAQWATASF
ncbi:MAG: hypothetical protein ACJ74H_05485 [Thermoanaerobaculia bacterium]